MTDVEMQMKEEEEKSRRDDNVRYLWKIPVDLRHAKSYCGILQLVIAFLSFIAFICCTSGRTADCDHAYASTYNFFDTMAMSTFLTMLLWWLFFMVTLDKRLRLVPWRLGELIILAAYGFLFLLADIIIAAQPCGKDSNRAAAAFGFFAVFAMAGHFYLSFKIWRETESPAALAARGPPQADAV